MPISRYIPQRSRANRLYTEKNVTLYDCYRNRVDRDQKLQVAVGKAIFDETEAALKYMNQHAVSCPLP